MTPAEVRAIVERVVTEHGQGWRLRRRSGRLCMTHMQSGASITVSLTGVLVWPSFTGVSWEDNCARAVALWPEMQRLVSMLREALAGPKAGT